MNLAVLHDDEIVREMSRRLERGTVGFAGLCSPHQLDARGAWHQVVLLLNRWQNDVHMRDAQHVRELAGLVNALSDRAASAPVVFALNTTMLGREKEFTVGRP